MHDVKEKSNTGRPISVHEIAHGTKLPLSGILSKVGRFGNIRVIFTVWYVIQFFFEIRRV